MSAIILGTTLMGGAISGLVSYFKYNHNSDKEENESKLATYAFISVGALGGFIVGVMLVIDKFHS